MKRTNSDLYKEREPVRLYVRFYFKCFAQSQIQLRYSFDIKKQREIYVTGS